MGGCENAAREAAEIGTYLWCVFRTQGNALRMLIETARFVMTPMIRTASWLSLWSMKMSVTRKMSHRKPDVAQPEWMPPRCWSMDVQLSLNQRGVH